MARNFLLPRFIDDRGGGGGGPAESTAPRGREPFSTEKESTEEEREGGQKRIRIEGILKLVRAEQISGPEISLVTRYMYTRGSKREK